MTARRAIAAMSALMLYAASIQARANDLPPVGRSLFDQLTSRQVQGRTLQQIPYPFQALLAELQALGGTDELGRPGVAVVLIPLGRSLQRNASVHGYFAHPRVVAAVTGEVRSEAAPMLLRDRLFLGFQDEAGVIEVISYNEAAGRFEFQIVSDYRKGATPRVRYASRALCSACHHAAAPIFSRPGWDETNANPVVAAALAHHATHFHGVPVHRGVDVPNAIDESVARAGRLLLGQRLWREGCDAAGTRAVAIGCRQRLLEAVLVRKLRLRVAESDYDGVGIALAPLLAGWKARWPEGLPEPDPNIPNRDPFFGRAQQLADQRVSPPWGAEEIVPALDPMTPRAPVRVWEPSSAGIRSLLYTLGNFFTEADLQTLERVLSESPSASARVERLRAAIAAIAQDTIAGRTDALASAPMRRKTLLRALGTRLGSPLGPASQVVPAMPPAQLEVMDPIPAAVTEALQPFYRHCAACHAMATQSPPGFLHGGLDAVARQLARCAPRMHFRLSMWELPAADRPKVPMPPPVFVPGWAHAPPRNEIARMLEYLQRGSSQPPLGQTMQGGYEQLPPCRDTALDGPPAMRR